MAISVLFKTENGKFESLHFNIIQREIGNVKILYDYVQQKAIITTVASDIDSSIRNSSWPVARKFCPGL